jgi:hypothetical protein
MDTPTLSETQRLQIQNAVLTRKLAEAEFVMLIQSLHQPGFLLDLKTLTYQPAPTPPADPPAEG